LCNRETNRQEWESSVEREGRKSRGVKRERRTVNSCLPSYNKYSALSSRVMNKRLIDDNTEGVRDLRHILQPLKEVWMTVGMEKVDTHEGVIVKALLDSGAIGMFANKKFVERNGFKEEKLDRAVKVKNVDRTKNNRGLVMHEIEVNMYYQRHVERMRLDVCNLGRIEVILGMPWLAAHNPEIDWEKRKVKMTRCPPLYGKNEKIKKRKEVVRRRETRRESH